MSLPCPINKNQNSKFKNQNYNSKFKNILNFKNFTFYSVIFNFKFLTLNSRRRRGGFTFIEVLVGVGLIGILTAIGVASYNNFNEKRVVKSAADKIRSNLRFAQTKALAGEKDCNSCGGTACDVSLVGWYADFSSRQIYGECGTTQFGYKDIGIDSSLGLTLTNIPDNKILFKPLGRGNNLTNEATITVSNVGGGNPQSVYVTPGGDIR